MIVTTEIKLKDEVVAEIRANQYLKNRLKLELDMSNSTLYRMLAENSDRLTTATALKIIGEELKKTTEELLTSTI